MESAQAVAAKAVVKRSIAVSRSVSGNPELRDWSEEHPRSVVPLLVCVLIPEGEAEQESAAGAFAHPMLGT